VNVARADWLKAEEGLLSALFQTSPDIIAVSSLAEGTYLEINDAFTEISGYGRDEAVGRTSAELAIWSSPEDRERLIGLLARNGRAKDFETEFRTKDGSRRRFSITATIISFRGTECMLTVCRDVSAMNELMTGLQKSRFLLERAEEMASIGSWEFDFARRMVEASQGAYRIYGFEPGEFSVQAVEAVPLPEDRPRLDGARNALIERGEPYDIEFKIARRSDGAVRDIHSKARWDPATKKLFGIIRDVTEERAAAARLEELNRNLEAKVEERTAELSKANAELESALGQLKRAQNELIVAGKFTVLGQLAAGIAHELNTPLGAILSAGSAAKAALDDYSIGAIRRLATLDDEARELYARMLKEDSARGVSIPRGSQMTRRRDLAARLEARGTAGAAEKAAALVDLDLDYLADALPELLDSKDCLELVDAAGLMITARRMGETVVAAAEQAAAVVGALRQNIQGQESGEMSVVDLESDLDAVLLLLHGKLKRGVEVRRRYGRVFALGSSPRLCQVWTNLVNNAAQAMGYSGVLEVATEARGDKAAVSVIDSGPGLSEAARARIFEPFFTTKAQGEGLGLGLSISKRIVESMGGSISFESAPGRTAFTVVLPSAEASG
jgi:PAS domain S-box-containing protein